MTDDIHHSAAVGPDAGRGVSLPSGAGAARGWLLGALALVALFYLPLLQSERLMPHGDFAHLFVPGQAYAARGLVEGVWPLWNPYQFMGSPFHAGMQSALFYPPHWPLRLFASGPGGALATLHLGLMLHLLWLAAGLFFLGRRWLQLPPPAAALVAVAMTCGAFTWNHLPHFNQILSLAWVPWILLAGHGIAVAPSRVNVAGLGVAVACGVLVGHPQNIALGLIAMGLLLPAWLLGAGCGWRAAAVRVALMAAAGGLSLLLAGVQIVPTAELTRQAWIIGEGEGWAESIALPVVKWGELLNPHAFGGFSTGRAAITEGWMHDEFGVYVGIATLVLAILGMLGGVFHRPLRLPVLFLAVLAVFGGVMAVGKATPLFDLVLTMAPPLNKFRVPARYLLLFHMAVALLAGVGAWRLAAWTERIVATSARRAVMGVVGGVALLLIIYVDLYAASVAGPFRHMLAARPVPLGSPLWQALEESGSVSLEEETTVPPGRLFWMIREDHYHRSSPDAVATRADQFNPNNNLLYRLEMVQGYGESLQPTLRFRDFLYTWHRSFYQARPDVDLLRAMNVAWLVTDIDAPLELADEGMAAEGPVAMQQRGGDLSALRLYRVPDPLPRVFEEAALPRDGMDGILDGLWRHKGQPIGGMNQQMQPWRDWLPARPVAGVREARAAGARKIVVGSPRFNTLSFQLVGTGHQLLVSQGAYPGWVLEEEGRLGGGRRVETSSAFLQQLPADLPEGKYRLAFRPGSFRWGLLLTALGTLCLGALLAPLERRRGAGLDD